MGEFHAWRTKQILCFLFACVSPFLHNRIHKCTYVYHVYYIHFEISSSISGDLIGKAGCNWVQLIMVIALTGVQFSLKSNA